MPVRDEKHMQEQRQRIIKAAFSCFLREGFQKTSIRAICKEAGLAVGTLYIHFKDRNEIISSMKSMAYDKPIEEIKFNEWGDFLNFLTATIDFKKNPDSLKYAVCDFRLAVESLSNEDLRQLFNKRSKELLIWVKACLSQFVEQGQIELPLGIDTTAQALRYLIDGITTSQIIFEDSQGAQSPVDVFNKTLSALIRIPGKASP